MDLLAEELRRCVVLGIPFFVTHPGAHMGTGEEAGVKRAAAAIDRAHEMVPDNGVITCLEVTAGQGTCLGHRLEHLAGIIHCVKSPQRMGVCLDTAHLFAAGYDFRGSGYGAFIKQVDTVIGLSRVKVWHVNDSRKDLGSRVDRHAHIGEGFIGLDGFRPLVRDERWAETPKILETPKEKDGKGRDWDEVNLRVLRRLGK